MTLRVLVLTQVSIPATGRTIPVWESTGGIDFVLHSTVERPDAIIGMGVGAIRETLRAVEQWPDVPLYVYHWDCYSWVWTRPRPDEYDYTEYGRLLRRCREVWVPSNCTGWQAELWWGLRNWKTIWPACPWWDHSHVEDGGYALCTLRKLPDLRCDDFERACTKVGIPFLRTDHRLTREQYEDAVAGCRFIVNHYDEASTGGLTLLEAYRLGKPVLCTDSRWNGAGEYFRERASYFQAGNMADFQDKLVDMHRGLALPRSVCQPWVESNFSDRRMVAQIAERVVANA